MSAKENKIEKDFIGKLQALKYTYRPDIRDNEALEQNFRQKFQALNQVNLTDNEFTRLLEQIISPHVFKTSKRLRETNSFEREDGTPLHYTLVNIKDWCKNTFEVINQLKINTRDSSHRYDVILLLNGLPLVQIELKTLQISPRRAMQQIIDYKKDAGNGYTNKLLCFMQLFIVSNLSNTYYFANNDNKHFSFDADERFLPIYQYADKKNKKITHLDEFSDAFLSKCKLAEMINRYMVLVQSEAKLMMMRPYQIYAVEAIVECIDDNRGNGYIWHTTGSGKTLTSFKASTLLKSNDTIKKVLFVVDRKDLDRQTREEFNKFQENCVEENTNTYTLVERLLSTDYADKVIVTTIQKLGLALDGTNKNNYKEKLAPLANERVVFIFDECHRSQFGKNHNAIKAFFPNSQLFGFTGTPIFEQNAQSLMIEDDIASLKTTQDIFEKELHNYTITHAIEDGNVLRFHIDYFKPEGEEAQKANTSKKAVVEAILAKHDQTTADKKFNAVFATASINDAIDYFRLFKEQDHVLNIACVFSPPAEGNKDVAQLQEDLPTEREDNKIEPNLKKEALKEIIDDYNQHFSTNHSLNNFDVYYQDVQTRIKNQKYPNADLAHKEKIDITIVVDMLLTGFDSQFLNTLYVDKNLKYHGLIQAFSRTNRVLNDTKPYGNILDFRALQNEVDEAIALFSGEDTNTPKEIWLVETAPKTIEKFKEATEKLAQFMQAHDLENKPHEIANLKGDEARAEFINTFKEIQRLKTQLDQHTDLKPEQVEAIEAAIPNDDLRAFKSMYLETAKRLQHKRDKGEQVPDEVEQLDFEFVLFASALIDYDYIMSLVSQYASNEPKKQSMSKAQLINLLKSNANLLDEQAELIAYINSLEVGKALDEESIKKGYADFRSAKNTTELNALAQKNKLETTRLQSFVDIILDRSIFDGEQLTDLLAPLELGWKERRLKELALMEELSPLLRKMAKGRELSGLEAYDE
ncbi:MAG: type I restriction enzyme, R subunit [Methyloprofundus sp.]|nr:MAG: type I restriction enzyme, R subunit [Methyloprofundus sp.]